jgi:hypothetical protein
MPEVSMSEVSMLTSGIFDEFPFLNGDFEDLDIEDLDKLPFLNGDLVDIPSVSSRRKLKVPQLSSVFHPISGFMSCSDYRRLVAIPLYLYKKKRRNWDRKLMHPSRSTAAYKRSRDEEGGKFAKESKRKV